VLAPSRQRPGRRSDCWRRTESRDEGASKMPARVDFHKSSRVARQGDFVAALLGTFPGRRWPLLQVREVVLVPGLGSIAVDAARRARHQRPEKLGLHVEKCREIPLALASWCAGSALKRPRESVPATPAPAVHDLLLTPPARQSTCYKMLRCPVVSKSSARHVFSARQYEFGSYV